MKALALWVAAAATILLLAATSTQLGWAVQRRVLLQQPRVGADMGAAPRPPTPIRPASSLGAKRSPGRVEGPRTMLELPSEGAAARYRAAYQLCRGPDKGAPPLPKLKRAVGWPGEDPTRDGNTTIVTSLHVEQ